MQVDFDEIGLAGIEEAEVELRGGDEDQQILLPALTGGDKCRLAATINEKLERPG